MVLDIDLFREEKGFDPNIVRESQKRRYFYFIFKLDNVSWRMHPPLTTIASSFYELAPFLSKISSKMSRVRMMQSWCLQIQGCHPCWSCDWFGQAMEARCVLIDTFIGLLPIPENILWRSITERFKADQLNRQKNVLSKAIGEKKKVSPNLFSINFLFDCVSEEGA